MDKKDIRGRSGSDPNWVQDIASVVQETEFDVNNKEFRELFFEYKRDGLTTKEAMEKAKAILAAFQPQK